jgi:hypothetical protein
MKKLTKVLKQNKQEEKNKWMNSLKGQRLLERWKNYGPDDGKRGALLHSGTTQLE